MESVALSDEQLNYLSRQDCVLNRYFKGVFASDELPKSPWKTSTAAYIVNTDPHDKPGKHWLGMWVDNGVCEIMDSYSMPLGYYESKPLEKWTKQWKYLVTNGQALQALRSNSCGHYCLFYLKAKARGADLQEFLSYFSKKDYVDNDHKVGQMLKRVITNEKQWKRVCNCSHKQRCISRQ